MMYVCPYLNEFDEAIRHAERVINGSSVNPIWWKMYRNQLLKSMLKHQLLEFQK